MEGGAVGHNFEMGLPKDYPCQVWFNLVQRFQRKNLNVIYYQNMPNLHNRYKSAERKISQKSPEYIQCSLGLSPTSPIAKILVCPDFPH
jgi:hypothetical protein